VPVLTRHHTSTISQAISGSNRSPGIHPGRAGVCCSSVVTSVPRINTYRVLCKKNQLCKTKVSLLSTCLKWRADSSPVINNTQQRLVACSWQ
jgi:hypothetical protein